MVECEEGWVAVVEWDPWTGRRIELQDEAAFTVDLVKVVG